jgi:hypothetical protein
VKVTAVLRKVGLVVDPAFVLNWTGARRSPYVVVISIDLKVGEQADDEE